MLIQTDCSCPEKRERAIQLEMELIFLKKERERMERELKEIEKEIEQKEYESIHLIREIVKQKSSEQRMERNDV